MRIDDWRQAVLDGRLPKWARIPTLKAAGIFTVGAPWEIGQELERIGATRDGMYWRPPA